MTDKEKTHQIQLNVRYQQQNLIPQSIVLFLNIGGRVTLQAGALKTAGTA